MNCVKTLYKTEMTANQVIRRSKSNEWKRTNKARVYRASYKCPQCGFFHIKKSYAPIINAETERVT